MGSEMCIRDRDKSAAADKLLPIIAEIKDNIRRDHYLQKLTKLLGISYNVIEATLKEYLARRKAQKPKQEATIRAIRPLVPSRLEEDFLILLLQHPELEGNRESFSPEYLENSENREIFIAWQQADDLTKLKQKLDVSIHEHLDSLMNRNLPSNQLEQRYADYSRRLKERYFKNLEAQRAEVFASAAESEGAGADLAKLEEEGIEPSVQLREVFAQKIHERSEPRR